MLSVKIEEPRGSCFSLWSQLCLFSFLERKYSWFNLPPDMNLPSMYFLQCSELCVLTRCYFCLLSTSSSNSQWVVIYKAILFWSKKAEFGVKTGDTTSFDMRAANCVKVNYYGALHTTEKFLPIMRPAGRLVSTKVKFATLQKLIRSKKYVVLIYRGVFDWNLLLR